MASLTKGQLSKPTHTVRPHGGGRGIRTPGAREGSTVFKTAAFNHSAIPPAPGMSNRGSGFASPHLRMLTARKS